MTTRLLIARHGNTFSAGEIPRRVGKNTDIPLSPSGEEQARKLGNWLSSHHHQPDIIITSQLRRTKQTAAIAMEVAGFFPAISELSIFDEIDYGPDENKPEEEVIARVGADAMAKWDRDAIPPKGWLVDPQSIINDWLAFGDTMVRQHAGKTILVVTSNGIARFAPYLTGDFASFAAENDVKIRTGAICLLEYNAEGGWQVNFWNLRP